MCPAGRPGRAGLWTAPARPPALRPASARAAAAAGVHMHIWVTCNRSWRALEGFAVVLPGKVDVNSTGVGRISSRPAIVLQAFGANFKSYGLVAVNFSTP